MTEAELEKQLAQNLQDEIKREAEKAKRVPTPFRLGPLHTLREAAEQMGVGALKALPDGRGYALDAQGRLELASLALATMKSKKNLTAVIEAMADTPVILVLDDGKGGKIEK